MSKRELPEINAGSMADIAFLLLIFFLVTTTMEADSGIFRKLPPKQNVPIDSNIKAKNILEISLNKNNDVLVDNEMVTIDKLQELAMNFIDNGAGLDTNQKPCDWCKGTKNPKSSDHPTKAVISINADRETNYETYVLVLDKVNSAYATLRNRLSHQLYKISYNDLLAKANDKSKNNDEIIEKINVIREKYPQLISDAEITR